LLTDEVGQFRLGKLTQGKWIFRRIPRRTSDAAIEAQKPIERLKQ
jgi:hypothetical protein